MSGRDSRVYDRDFKRDAYLRLGVREFWRLDLQERRLYQSLPDGPTETPFVDRVTWHPPEMAEPLILAIPPLFGSSEEE